MKKMKRRFLALLLCVAMILNISPTIPAHASSSELLTVMYDGDPVDSVVLPVNERIKLKADRALLGSGTYQWQILAYDTLWVDIAGAEGKTVEISYAMIANLLENDEAVIRCKVTKGENVTYSSEVVIEVDYDVATDSNAIEVEEESPSNARVASGSNADEDDEEVTTEPVKVSRVFSLLRRAVEGSTDGATTYALSTYNIVINYSFVDGTIAADPYTANLAAGSSFNQTVTFPTIQGYLPYIGDDQKNSIDLSYPDIQDNVTISVVYKPTNVNYTVIHYKQNLNDDNYTEALRETKQGLTASFVPDNVSKIYTDENDVTKVAEGYEGFYALLFEKPEIAADGSTVVEIYYDRYYYLMNFDLDGGYGVEPIYARFGTPIEVGTPVKQGYTFSGWNPEVPAAMPAENQTHLAIWGNANTVNYTVVYWKENANDSNYSFWGQVTKQAVAGTTVSGSDDIPNSITTTTVDGNSLNEKPYFSFNAAKTNKDVVVNGDGTTIVNVYYYRNTYHLYFYGISGECAIEEHTHGDGKCNSYLDCLQSEHTHDENCERVLTCTLEEHAHTEACYNLTCEIPEHTEHTEDCLICGLEEHDHVEAGCKLNCTHVHTLECYQVDNTNSYITYSLQKTTQPTYELTDAGNGIYTYKISNEYPIVGTITTTYYYLNIGEEWYCAARTKYNGKIEYDATKMINLSCNHTHADECYSCGLIKHSHIDTCYTDTLHTHDVNCYSITCGQTAHTHSDRCYAYTCGAEEHTHSNSCYRPCTKLKHTHMDQCYDNRNDNVIYVISAKYEQNIADVWPTANKFRDYTLKGWTIDGIDNMAVSKRVSMTSDLCDTSDNLKYAEAKSGGTKQYLFYMFESFDQTSAASGDQRKMLNWTYYDSDSRYYQQVNSGSTKWGHKPIEGMSPVGEVEYDSNDTKVFLYYNRNRSKLMFNNSSDSIVKTVSNIMYEQPLANYKDSEGNLISSFTPSYPSKLEPNAYEFKGWYTTPECYDGTEFNFSTATMPNGDLTLYAKWSPIIHTVSFYLDKNAMESETKLSTHQDKAVPHGSKVEPVPEDPTNGSYTFIGWFYMDNGEEKAFDFANMPVNRDLQVYGKWSSNVLKEYTIYYKIKGIDTPIADPTVGSALAGITKTFDAKGGSDLYPLYQECYFPLVQSHSMTLDINATEMNNTNVYTFEYVQKDAVPYIVRYVDENGNELTDLTPKVVADNRKAVVTETFVTYPGYMPDAYQKRLVVTGADLAEGKNWIEVVDDDGNTVQVHPDNVITFVYKKDDKHAYYKITHFTENLERDSQGNRTWTEYTSSQIVGDINTIYTAEPITIPGFTYDGSIPGTVTQGTLTANGLELKLYYTRNIYPYQVRYLEQGTGAVLHDPKNGSGKYGKVISEDAIDIEDYDKVDPTSQTLNIRVEESKTEAKINIITFYYKEQEVTINYVAVSPTGATGTEAFGSVSPESETLKIVHGTAQGSTATVASDEYYFVGWYKDHECTQPVTEDDGTLTGNKFTPAKVNKKNVAATYYAKFEYAKADLTITKAGSTVDKTDKFVFNVKDSNGKVVSTVTIKGTGSVTVKDLPTGTYTVEEDTSWSWRYTPDETSKSVSLAGQDDEVTFTNTKSKNKWIDGSTWCQNIFRGTNNNEKGDNVSISPIK